jgi:hypothetical protein
MLGKISEHTKHEVLKALRGRYQVASKIEKDRILDEFVALADCHRKHALRLLAGRDPAVHAPSTSSRRIYSEAVCEPLIVRWEAADRIRRKRLKAILPRFISAMERNGHLALDETVWQQLLTISAATIDRLLTPIRVTAVQRWKRKPATKCSR